MQKQRSADDLDLQALAEKSLAHGQWLAAEADRVRRSGHRSFLKSLVVPLLRN